MCIHPPPHTQMTIFPDNCRTALKQPSSIHRSIQPTSTVKYFLYSKIADSTPMDGTSLDTRDSFGHTIHPNYGFDEQIIPLVSRLMYVSNYTVSLTSHGQNPSLSFSTGTSRSWSDRDSKRKKGVLRRSQAGSCLRTRQQNLLTSALTLITATLGPVGLHSTPGTWSAI